MPFPRLACMAARAVRSLEHALGRNAGNFPGAVAKRIDKNVLAWQAGKIGRGSVVVSATNGKTTTTNLIADCLEAAGTTAFCNRDGSNLESGIVTALLDPGTRDVACLECDEMYARFVLPKLRPRAFVLLNLFEGDQVYRFGSMGRIYDSIATALAGSPETVFVYNADDPHCQAIAERVENPKVTFGMEGKGDGGALDAAGAERCPRCGEPLSYTVRRYGQIGRFSCASCGFHAPEPDVVACDVRETADGYAASVRANGKRGLAAGAVDVCDVEIPCSGSYMVYNVVAARIASAMLGCPEEAFRSAVSGFDPKNGRLQRYLVGGRRVLSNLAKNPVGFNQNIQMALKRTDPMALGFYMDDMVECDGDYSWVDGIEFAALADLAKAGCPAFFGGEGAEPRARALGRAGIPARRADSARETLEALAADDPGCERMLFVVANYHALERLRAELMALEAKA